MTERRILTLLGQCAHPVPVARISEYLRLPYAAERATGELWGRALVVREIVDEGGDMVSQVWTLSPRGRQVVEAGFMVHPHDRAVHIVRGPWALPAIAPSPMASSYSTSKPAEPRRRAALPTIPGEPARVDPADAWLATLPKAPDEVKPEIAPTLVWTYDGAQMVARAAERTEHVITLTGVTVIRAGHLFDQEDARYPFLVLRENSVVGMGPMVDEQDPSNP